MCGKLPTFIVSYRIYAHVQQPANVVHVPAVSVQYTSKPILRGRPLGHLTAFVRYIIVIS